RMAVELFSQDVPQWRGARAELSRWSRNRYLLATRAQYYAAPVVAQGVLQPLPKNRLFWLAGSSLTRGPGFARKLKLLLKGILHSNTTDWEDAITIATEVLWSENNAVVRGKETVFDDGLVLPATSDIVRLLPFRSRFLAVAAHY